MIEHPETSEPDFLGDTFARALRGEPAMGLDLVAIERRGRRRLVRRRVAVMAGASLAVVTLTAGIAVGASGWVGSNDQAPMVGVPGCSTVLRTTDPVMLSWMYDGHPPTQTPTEALTGAESTAADDAPGDAGTVDAYSAPPWFTPDKAASMRTALDAALPSGMALRPFDAGTPLPFTDQPGGDGVLGDTRAVLNIQVQQWDRGAPPCTEVLSLRYVAPDGTVSDVISSGGSPGAVQQLTAEAFHPDGTLVTGWLSWSPSASAPPSGPLPLSDRQLAILIANPAFAVS